MKKVLFLLLSFFLLPLAAEVGYVEPWGKEAHLVHPVSKEVQPKKHNLWVKMASQVIYFHQNILSPVDGPRSHYRPSSSQYMLFAMQKHGFTKGFIMGCDRLMRENKDPWCYRKTLFEGKLMKWDPVD